jgi:thiol-disulfide isomerase/thioredoxin
VFWGFWCPPCNAMLPHEKELVARLADKPFALIGVNTDEHKDEFKKRIKDQGITWKNSWQGSRQGPWSEAWGIGSYPAVFVLDEKGVIRATNVRGEELSKVVDDLLAKMGQPKPEPPKSDPKSGDKPQPK